jgi:predicted RNA binding protein YcfA (HicA-like mRNA interferase family)
MSKKLPALKSKKVLQALQRAGFFVHHATGSHYILKHGQDPTHRVTVPYHGKDLKRRTLESIIDQAGLTIDEFLALL